MAGGADYVFKLVIIGDQSVGKSSLIRRFHEDSFDQKLPTTIGVDFFIHDLVVNGRNVKLQLWDTAGQERFRGAITNAYYRGADGALVVFDLSNKSSFDSVKNHWLQEFYRVSGSDAITILAGSKCDLKDERQVEETEIKEFASLHFLEYLETSAKECTNVKEAFEIMAKKLVESYEQYLSLPTSLNSGLGSFTLHGAYGVPLETTGYWDYCCSSSVQRRDTTNVY